MRVFFTCSTKSIDKNAKYYRAIRDEAISQGHKINRDWIDYSINLAERGIKGSPTHTFYEDVMTAILTADAVIADVTVRSMAIGHQVTHALLNNKPVLVLKFKNPEDGNEKLFIEGSNSKFLNVYDYTSVKDIKKIIQQFFKKYENKPKKRFNLVLTGILNNYLSWASFYYKKTKTEIIHEAIEKMAEHDSLYKKYLSRKP